jgi:Rod binding domain-containing protein
VTVGSLLCIGYHLFTATRHSAENPPQPENPMLPPVPAIPASADHQSRRDLLMSKAQDLEAAFLAEMLSHAGLDEMEGDFSGGLGEAQYASFLREAQAKAMVEKGGIGLAERLFQSMTRTDHA